MMTYKKQISTLAMAVAMTLAMVSEANAVTFPFTGVKVTPPQDVIAANLDEITPHNTVTVVHNITQVTPTLTASQMPNPTSASFGVVTAFKDPNMSQKVPDCAPPPTPPSNCNNIGQCGSPGNVSWSGWDKVSGGVCNTGGAGGWMVTAAGAAPANYYPPPPAPAASSSGGGGYAALNSAAGISSNGITTQCNGGTCTITYGIGTGYGFNTVTKTVSLSTLQSGSVSLAGTSATVNISGGNVNTVNSGITVSTSAATNLQTGGASIAQQNAGFAVAAASGYGKESTAVQQQVAAASQQQNAQLMTYGNGANSSSVSQAIGSWG